MSGRVVVGFGNSMGRLHNPIFEDKYQVIQRLGSKINIAPPMVRPLKSNQLDMDHLKVMIGQRRNHTLLNSFLNFSQEDDTSKLFTIQEQAQRGIKSIDEELGMMKVMAADLKLNKFMAETKVEEYRAMVYLQEFNNDVDKAIKTYKQREAIIKSFASKNNMNFKQAEDILKANGYNAHLFD